MTDKPKKPTNQNRRPQSKNPSARHAGAAARTARRNREMANKLTNAHRMVSDADKAAFIVQTRKEAKTNSTAGKLKITFLGGQNGIGEKNLIVFEYGDDAVVIDAGIDLSVELPGINYAIGDFTYLESIKHKVKGYIFTHGHMDHIGAVPYLIPKIPAPVIGTQFTLGMVEKQFETEFELEKIVLNSDNHDRIKVGCFMVESIRVTHSIPDCSMIVLDTPVGRVLHTGDFRLDPEPLDRMPTDMDRLKQVADEGLLLLMSESTYAQAPGRVPTEHTLKESIHDLIARQSGRIFVSCFSSNINRVQMFIDAAVAAGRKVAIDGRSLLAHIELAVKLGYIKIPRGTIVSIRDLERAENSQVMVICTGGQGEENSALVRMSTGEHQHIKLKAGDTVIVSSTPIPGNEVSYEVIGNNLTSMGVNLYTAKTYEVDGCGPLHVSGHAKREELKEVIELTKPKFFIPIYAGNQFRKYHQQLAESCGVKKGNALLAANGESVLVDENSMKLNGRVPYGSQLIDQTGALVPDLVVHDRILMGTDGIVVVVLTIDRKSGQLLSSPDIISRGFVYMRDSEDMMSELRTELRRFALRRYNKVEINRFKQELRDHVNGFLFKHTDRSPITIPVVNAVGQGGKSAQVATIQSRNTVGKHMPVNPDVSQFKGSYDVR
jgi:ribonuclease J